jgi:hypothetical protein
MLAVTAALTADAVARQARPEPTVEAVAPRDAGEPIMAIVSIKSQQVTFYDADGWIVRAVNVSPPDLAHRATRETTMEGYWARYRGSRSSAAAENDEGAGDAGPLDRAS